MRQQLNRPPPSEACEQPATLDVVSQRLKLSLPICKGASLTTLETIRLYCDSPIKIGKSQLTVGTDCLFFELRK